ncbi:MAG: T9SS type A sorting domain-containing protein [Bacteroidetes bacterium]|nr:T9SS type A sorting domain-containing protein [Bacteroidota bacterium]
MKKLILPVLTVIGTWTTNISNAQWQQTSLPSSSTVICFAVSGSNMYAGTKSNGIFLSTDNGNTWTAKNTGLTTTVNYVYALAISGNNIFAGTSAYGVFLSTDNGNNWTPINTGLTNKAVHTLAVSGSNIFAGTTGGGIFLSTNNGNNWTAMNNGLTSTTVTSLTISGSNIFAGTTGGIFLSTNNGGLWTQILSGKSINTIAISGSNIFAGTLNGVYLSTDNGNTWNWANGNLSQGVTTFAFSGTNVFAGLTDGYTPGSGGVFLSTNNGNTWTAVNTGLTNTMILELVINGNYLFAGTQGAGAWKRLLSEIVGIEEHTVPSDYFSLYPNPASAYFMIRNTNDAINLQSLSLTDILGNEILSAKIKDEETKVNIETLPKGVYFVQLTTDKGVSSLRLIKE